MCLVSNPIQPQISSSDFVKLVAEDVISLLLETLQMAQLLGKARFELAGGSDAVSQHEHHRTSALGQTVDRKRIAGLRLMSFTIRPHSHLL